ncbi:hypothetical protein G4B88_003204 [Cannabis sativa]|uniref:Pentatricopeptide repeat-containing protein n=1 Tax=Cannabis sativa TaxID=3483 RepID=A0A7J6I427_CANSA|nr:hypothetical protein G4B88_003204 [Cannabis sativa]
MTKDHIWSSLERRCFYLLQRRNTIASLLQIHAFMLRNALETNLNLLTKFITALTSPPLGGHQNSIVLLSHARQVFDKRPHRDDIFLCNCMIKGHTNMQQFAESFSLYGDLRRNTGFVPNGYTFVILVKSCASKCAIREGQEIHSLVAKTGFCSNMYVLTALVDMYAKFGNMSYARMLFDGMNERNQVSWTALICGYARLGDMINARELFNQMPEKDSATDNVMIDGYAKLGEIGSARNLFNKMTDRNVVSWTSMIYGYCRGGYLQCARFLFNAMQEKNLISWNTMISGYCQNRQPREALKLFHEMQMTTSLEPDHVTIVSILPAIADLGALDLGGWIHQFARSKRLDKLTKISTALIDMYAKCGEISRAKIVFDEMPEKETASWNAMINGLAVNGRGHQALELFLEMQHKKLKPNDITFLGVLSACNHSGLVDEGKKWFEAMEGFELVPRIEHYGCMIDLLGKAGCLEEAEKLIERMPYEANGIILSSFLSACGYFNDFSRAKKALENAVQLEPENDGNYVTMRNLYASERRWGDADETESLMAENGANKEVGLSVIEVDGTIQEFVSGNRLEPHWECLHLTLGQLWKHMTRSLYSQMLDYLSGKVYNEFVAKNISTPDDFQVAILDIFNTLNTGLPGKHYDVPPRDEVKEFFYNVWNKASSEDKRTKFVKFIAMHVKPNKIDRATMITGIVTPPIAMAAKRSGENVPQLKMIKAVPDALFVPFTTVVALFSVKITRRFITYKPS